MCSQQSATTFYPELHKPSHTISGRSILISPSQENIRMLVLIPQEVCCDHRSLHHTDFGLDPMQPKSIHNTLQGQCNGSRSRNSGLWCKDVGNGNLLHKVSYFGPSRCVCLIWSQNPRRPQTVFEHMNTVFEPLKALCIPGQSPTVISTMKTFFFRKKISVTHCIILCRIITNHICYIISFGNNFTVFIILTEQLLTNLASW
jgi:hypothetical protein